MVLVLGKPNFHPNTIEFNFRVIFSHVFGVMVVLVLV